MLPLQKGIIEDQPDSNKENQNELWENPEDVIFLTRNQMVQEDAWHNVLNETSEESSEDSPYQRIYLAQTPRKRDKGITKTKVESWSELEQAQPQLEPKEVDGQPMTRNQ